MALRLATSSALGKFCSERGQRGPKRAASPGESPSFPVPRLGARGGRLGSLQLRLPMGPVHGPHHCWCLLLISSSWCSLQALSLPALWHHSEKCPFFPEGDSCPFTARLWGLAYLFASLPFSLSMPFPLHTRSGGPCSKSSVLFVPSP